MDCVLGLDVSTSCTGWAVFTDNGEFRDMGSIVLPSKMSLYEKAGAVRDALSTLFISHPICKVYIEENLQSFRRGFSSAKTLSTLARFNGIVSMVAYETYSVEPIHLNVNAARKTLGIKLVRKSKGGAPTKQQVYEWVDSDVSKMKSYTWPTKTLKSGPRKDQQILDPTAYDMADAYVIAKAGILS